MRQISVTTPTLPTQPETLLAGATLLLGLVLLVGGGGLLVRGASEIAEGLGISPMVIGLTVVAFGTSMPELVVNALGSYHGETGLAFGNVLGSNISNLALVLGAAAVIAPISVEGALVKREIPLLLLATTIMTVMALDNWVDGQSAMISRSEAIVLLLLFCIFLYATAMDFVQLQRKDRILADVGDYPLAALDPASRFRWPLTLGGCVLLFFGGSLTVDSAVSIASGFGVSATIIGLFVVAIGTSLPELVTSIIAAVRKESDLALGNVVGSNLFNSLFVLPIGALVTPIPIPEGGLLDLVASWLLVAMLIPLFIFGKARLGRGVGGLLLVLYCGYAIVRMA